MSDEKKCGVYMIRNKVNGKVYIGSAAKSFIGRWRIHRHHLRSGTHHSAYLQHAWNKYGEESFEFCILQITLPEVAVEVEQSFIDRLQSADGKSGYNCSPTAGSCRGMKASAETKSKMSLDRRGKKLSAEHIANRSAAQRGMKQRPEVVEARAAANRGKKHSPETCANMSACQTGKRHSAETKTKIGDFWRGKKKSPEAIEKTAAAHRGSKRSPEACENNANAQRGKKLSPESVAKRSATVRLNNIRKKLATTDIAGS